MKISKELREFYQAYVEWLDNGAPEGRPFIRYAGMCYNALRNNNIEASQFEEHFVSEGLDKEYPFGVDAYEDCSYDDTMHLDPNRIAWARKWAKEEYDGE